jgi:hypothetical protein
VAIEHLQAVVDPRPQKQSGRRRSFDAVDVPQLLCGVRRYVAFSVLLPVDSGRVYFATPHNGCSLDRTVPHQRRFDHV